jgi:F420 biosynthesis protein FbiB-like protein
VTDVTQLDATTVASHSLAPESGTTQINAMSDTHDSFWQTLFQRRSIRRFRPEPLPATLLQRLLTAAIWAPSAHNRQPWRFAVLTTSEAKHALARAMAARWQEDLQAAGLGPDAIAARLQRSTWRITTPPALVLGSITLQEMDVYDDAALQQAEALMATQSLSLALGNLMLAAWREGVGSCWICAPLFASDAVRQVLHLPHSWQPQALIALGYPAETKTSTRKPLSEVVTWL